MPRRSAALVAIAALALVLTGPLSQAMRNSEGGKVPLTAPPKRCAASREVPAWTTSFHGYDEARVDAFRCEDALLVANTALWRAQASGKEAVSESNRLLPVEWRFMTTSRVIDAPDGLKVMEFVVDRDTRPWVIWQWYAVGTAPAATGARTKLREALNAIRFASEPVAQLAIGAEADSIDAARRLLEQHAGPYWRNYVVAQSSS